MNNEEFREACLKELKYVKKCERQMQQESTKAEAAWKAVIGGSIPEKVHVNLQAAFATAFGIIFENGVGVIEKTYNKEELQKNFLEHDFDVDTKRSRRELLKMRRRAAKSDRLNALITTVEGVGLGALGIGLPDIVIFLGFIMKSVYEVALKYGYDYEQPAERMLILKMMSASVQKQEKWTRANKGVDEILTARTVPDDDEIMEQIGVTADDFAIDMLVLKFIQGLPIVGVVGGLSNPVYYRKILQYVRIKYHKRYLLEKLEELEAKITD